MDKYYLTKHAVDRLLERAPVVLNHWPYLRDWSREKNPQRFRQAFEEIMARSSENKSILNDTGYMAANYWDKYGFDTEFSFYENQDYRIKFVFAKARNEDTFSLVTVAPFHGVQKENKWAKKISKEEKNKNFLLEEHERNKGFISLTQTVSPSLKAYSANFAIETPLHIKELLCNRVNCGESLLVETLSPNITIQKAVVENWEYEFKYHTRKPPATIEVYKVQVFTPRVKINHSR